MFSRTCLASVVLAIASAASAQVLAAQRPPAATISYAPGHYRFRLQLTSSLRMSSGQRTSNQADTLAFEFTLSLAAQPGGEPGALAAAVRVDTILVGGVGGARPSEPFSFALTARGWPPAFDVPPLQRAENETFNALQLCIPDLPASPVAAGATWPGRATSRTRTGQTLGVTDRVRSWRAAAWETQGTVRTLRIAGRDSLRGSTPEARAGEPQMDMTGAATIDAAVGADGVLRSCDGTEHLRGTGVFGPNTAVEGETRYTIEFLKRTSPVVLAAAAPRTAPAGGATDEALRDNLMRRALRELVSRQETYFASHSGYGRTIGEVGVSIPSGVSMEVDTAAGNGWTATAGHFATSRICRIWVGRIHLAGMSEGEVVCREPGSDDPGSPAPARLDDSSTEEQVVAAMQADLRRLVRWQQRFFDRTAEHLYSNSQSVLGGYVSSTNVDILIERAGRTGWSARARHPHARQVCRIFVGAPAIEGLTALEPRCAQPSAAPTAPTDPGEVAIVAQMRDALTRLLAAQDRYFAANSTYSFSAEALQFQGPEAMAVTINWASSRGWGAITLKDGTAWRCRIYDGVPPVRDVKPREPYCWAPSR